jgi:uncharacterized protein
MNKGNLMVLVIADAKRLNSNTLSRKLNCTIPEYLSQAKEISDSIRLKSPKELSQLLKTNKSLSSLNYERFARWQIHHGIDNSKPSLFAFNGDVYNGISALSLEPSDIDYAQKHLRIISGLYGLLKPLDLIQPYRIDMKTKIKVNDNKDLYSHWRDLLTDQLNEMINSNGCKETIVNLASDEYFKVFDRQLIKSEIINPIFIETKKNINKVVVVYTKRARGLMARFIIKNKIENPEYIKAFDSEGYVYSPDLSNKHKWVFIR